jgi:medium-chain acyl-[acyl-carrier-protein] hydrolase
MYTGWLVELNPGPAEKRLSLICVPYAGGGPTVFRPWARAVPAAVRLLALQLPGRESRGAEQALTAIPEIVAAAGPPVAAISGPLVIFGHSGGALVAFALARWLEERLGQSPISLVVSGSRAPSSPTPRAPLHGLPDLELRRRLDEMGGMPRELLAHEEFMELATPTLRADLMACETWHCARSVQVHCAILALAGSADRCVAVGQMQEWRHHTRASFSLAEIDGDHFFVRDPRLCLPAIWKVLAGDARLHEGIS